MATSAARRRTLVVGGDTIVIDPTLNVQEFEYNGSGTLLASTTISSAAIATTGITYSVKIRYNGSFILDGNTITIFGYSLSQEEAGGANTIFDCQYIGGAWEVHVSDSDSIQPKTVDGVLITTLSGAGGTVTLDPSVDYATQELIGSGTLAASYVYQGGGSPTNGDKFRVIYNGTFAATGNNITIFGYSLTDEQILYGGVTVDAEYNGTSWDTKSVSQNPSTQNIGDNFYIQFMIDFGTMADGIYVVMPMSDNVEMISAQGTILQEPTVDDATVEFGNSGITFTGGTDTITAASAVGSQTGVSIASGDGNINAGQYLSVTWNKATNDGMVFYFIRMRLRA